MKEVRCILIDNEIDALDGLEILLKNIGGVEIIEKISDSKNAVQRVFETKPDIVFLDIDMPIKNGFEVLEEINSLKINTKVVFVTAFNEYVLKALRNSAFDYLTKPVDRLVLKDVINKITETENNIANFDIKSLNMLKIPISNGCIFLKKEDIIYIEADGNYSKIITPDETIISSQNLGKYDTKFSNDNFLRISKSLLINGMYLSKFDKKNRICTLKYENKVYELSISRRNLKMFDNI